MEQDRPNPRHYFEGRGYSVPLGYQELLSGLQVVLPLLSHIRRPLIPEDFRFLQQALLWCGAVVQLGKRGARKLVNKDEREDIVKVANMKQYPSAYQHVVYISHQGQVKFGREAREPELDMSEVLQYQNPYYLFETLGYLAVNAWKIYPQLGQTSAKETQQETVTHSD